MKRSISASVSIALLLLVPETPSFADSAEPLRPVRIANPVNGHIHPAACISPPARLLKVPVTVMVSVEVSARINPWFCTVAPDRPTFLGLDVAGDVLEYGEFCCR